MTGTNRENARKFCLWYKVAQFYISACDCKISNKDTMARGSPISIQSLLILGSLKTKNILFA